MGYIIVTLIIILIISIISFLYWDDKYQKSDFEDRMKNSDIYLEIISKIDATDFEPEEMLSSIHVHSRYIEVNYFNPKPKGRGHSYKVEIADDKFDMSNYHRKTLLKLVYEYCIKNTDIEAYYNQIDDDHFEHNYITLNQKIARKYADSYKTPVC